MKSLRLLAGIFLVASAVFAADTILAARGNYRRAQLEPYVQRLTARFGRRLAGNAQVAGDSFIQRSKQKLAHWLLRRRWFARRIVLDRWFLHRQQPPLRS